MAAPTPNIEGDQTKSVLAAAISSMIICITFYTLRILARMISGTRILWSDVFLFGGVVACIGISTIDIYGESFQWLEGTLLTCIEVLRYGLGRHVGYVAITDPTLSGVVAMLKVILLPNLDIRTLICTPVPYG